MPIKRNIPNAMTSGNLLCGCLAIIKVFEGDLVWAAYLVGIAAVLDFFDGFVARLLKVSSPLGKDLDSLADMVTFGVVPGMVMYKLIINAIVLSNSNEILEYISDRPSSLGEIWSAANLTVKTASYLPYISLLIPLFSCIRLAIFNNDTRQSDVFIGVPTPANGIFIVSLPVAAEFMKMDSISAIGIGNPWVLAVICCVMSFLLVAPIRMIALKFKSFKWKGNEIRFSFLIFSVILFAFLQLLAVPLIIISYVLFSIINNMVVKPTE